MLWVLAILCIAEPGMGGSATGGYTGMAMSSTCPSSTVRMLARGVRFAALLGERRWGIVCVMPVPVPFLEFLKFDLMI